VAFSALRASSHSVAVSAASPPCAEQRRPAAEMRSPCSITARPDAVSRSLCVSPLRRSKAAEVTVV
jgi:hypothetical protein